jgi:hypothetical protein
VGQSVLGHEAVGDTDPAAWLTPSSRDGLLAVSPENLPAFPGGAPPGGAPPDVLPGVAGLARFTADLAELLGVTELLEPRDVRVRSYLVPIIASASIGFGSGSGRSPGDPPLAGYFAADLASVAESLRDSTAGPALSTFLRTPAAGGLEIGGEAARDIARVDVRREPLVVRDGCAPDRMPPARWPGAGPLVLSEQFAVNEILAARATALSAVHTPPGSDVTNVFSDLIAAIVTERARVLASLPSPEAAFGGALPEGSPVVAAPVDALTGFEILLVSRGADVPDLAAIGDTWLNHAAVADYFPATARLAGGTEAWALIRAHLDAAEPGRAFVDRFWNGMVPGTDALFRGGVSLRDALGESPAVPWPAAVARFRSALAEVQSLSAERSQVSATVTRLSRLEQACEDAYSALEDAQARVAELAEREPDARADLVAAEERRRVALADLRVHQEDKPGLVVAMSTGLRAGRDWYTAHGTLRAAFDAATRQRDRALTLAQELRAELAAARKTITRSRDTASRLAAEMDALHAAAATARRRWGDHMPEGPSYAETEDAALIELRESSAPWADLEFTTARTELFFAALALHKSLVHANADVFETNLSVWTDIVSGTECPPPAVTLAVWQSLFLVVPVVSTTFASVGSLLSGLGRDRIGWLLASGTEGVPARHVAGALWRTRHAVLAGSLEDVSLGDASLDEASLDEDSPGDASALHLAVRTARFGTSLPDGTWTGLPLYPRPSSDAIATGPGPESSGMSGAGSATAANQGETLQSALSDIRERARSRRPTRSA